MGDKTVSLPLHQLHSLIAGAFRRGAAAEHAGKIHSTEHSYIHSETHARRIIEELTDYGFIVVGLNETTTPNTKEP